MRSVPKAGLLGPICGAPRILLFQAIGGLLEISRPSMVDFWDYNTSPQCRRAGRSCLACWVSFILEGLRISPGICNEAGNAIVAGSLCYPAKNHGCWLLASHQGWIGCQVTKQVAFCRILHVFVAGGLY